MRSALNLAGMAVMAAGLWMLAGEVPVEVVDRAAVGLVVVGVGIGLFSVDVITSGHVDMYRRTDNNRLRVVATYHGRPGRAVGWAASVAAAVVVALGFGELPRSDRTSIDLGPSRALGVALAVVGAVLVARAGLVLATRQRAVGERQLRDRLGNVPSYLIAGLGLGVGVFLAGVGVLQLSDPGRVERTVDGWFGEQVESAPPAAPDR